jgi:glycosyltransferase involved in cell wall biosynthesis
VVCNSRAAASHLQEAGIRSHKLVVIPNGLPDKLFEPTTPALPREENVLRIGMISRMNHAVKQHDMFLRVAARLAPRVPQARFVLIGDGPLRPALEALALELGLRDRVLFLGDRRDIPAVLAALDVTVLPSASESLSNVIMEAMAAGIPVVASNVGGNPELVEHGTTGFLFPPGDEEQFAAALETLLAQAELRRQFGSAARERALAEYTIPQVRDRYQDLYLSLLAEKKWNPRRPSYSMPAASPERQRESH